MGSEDLVQLGKGALDEHEVATRDEQDDVHPVDVSRFRSW